MTVYQTSKLVYDLLTIEHQISILVLSVYSATPVTMATKWRGGSGAIREDQAKLEDFESRVDQNDKEQMSLLEV